MKENFLVTGGSGYVGKLLIHKLINDARVDNIVVIDRDDLKADLKNSPKVYFIHKNLVDDWQDEVKSIEEKNNFKITKVIHLAWHIRTIYGNKKLQNHWNIGGSQKVFDWVKKQSEHFFSCSLFYSSQLWCTT
jgi:nucleoside-diphosphate-sugar epimerase